MEPSRISSHPTKVYRLRADANRYQGLVLEEGDWDFLWDKFDGNAIADTWRPLMVRVFRDDGRSGGAPSDFPSLAAAIPVFSPRAIESLGDMLAGSGEILALHCPEGTYVAFNVTRVVDALDEMRSELKRFDDGRIMRIVRHEFHQDSVADVDIFKLPQMPKSAVYVSDRFVERIREAHLVGFKPELVWIGHGRAAESERP